MYLPSFYINNNKYNHLNIIKCLLIDIQRPDEVGSRDLHEVTVRMCISASFLCPMQSDLLSNELH